MVVVVVAVALPVLLLLAVLSVFLILLSSDTHGTQLVPIGYRASTASADEYYGNGGRKTALERFVSSSSDEIEWAAGSQREAPLPLLHLALERIARKDDDVHLERLENVRVEETWQEVTGDVELDSDPKTDRWYRWIVEACFYGVDDTHGWCERMDVRVKTAWRSGTPPTTWPVEVSSLGVVSTPTTSEFLLPPGVREMVENGYVNNG